MRTIDADALFREMEKAQWYNNADRDEIAEELVLNAPTIEPERKKGKWLYDEERCATGIYAICSACDESIYQTGNFRYCPNCGADMTEGD